MKHEIFTTKEHKKWYYWFWKIFIVVYWGDKVITHNMDGFQRKTLYNDKYFKWVIAFALIFIVISLIWDIVNYFKKPKDNQKQLALLINDEGITDYISQIQNLGVIRWEDMTFVGVKNTMLNTFLIIKLKNPQEYIDRITANFKLKQELKKTNAKYGTPLVWEMSNLDKNPAELRDLIKLEIQKRNLQ